MFNTEAMAHASSQLCDPYARPTRPRRTAQAQAQSGNHNHSLQRRNTSQPPSRRRVAGDSPARLQRSHPTQAHKPIMTESRSGTRQTCSSQWTEMHVISSPCSCIRTASTSSTASLPSGRCRALCSCSNIANACATCARCEWHTSSIVSWSASASAACTARSMVSRQVNLGITRSVLRSSAFLQFVSWFNFATSSGASNQRMLDVTVVLSGGSFVLVWLFSSVLCCLPCLAVLGPGRVLRATQHDRQHCTTSGLGARPRGPEAQTPDSKPLSQFPGPCNSNKSQLCMHDACLPTLTDGDSL